MNLYTNEAVSDVILLPVDYYRKQCSVIQPITLQQPKSFPGLLVV